MRAHRNDQTLDIVGDHVVAALHHCEGLRGAVKGLCAAGAHAQRKSLMSARLLDDGEHVVHQRIVHAMRFTCA